MVRRLSRAAGLLALAITGFVLPAAASTVSVQVTPAGITGISGFSGATIETFDSAPTGTFTSPVTLGNTTYSVNSGAASHIDGDFIGQYNNFGVNSLHNCYCDDSFSSLTFTFSQPVNAFGFHWGASDNQWTLSAYDASNTLLESFNLPITNGSNAGDFVGLIDAGIKYAVLSGDAGDYIFVDNVATTGVSTVPLPAGLPMFGTAVLMLGAIAWRRHRLS